MTGGHVRAALAPEVVLGDVKGVTVVLGALLSTSAGVVIYFYGLQDEITAAYDAEHAVVWQEWLSELEAAKSRVDTTSPRPPTEPGTLLMNDMRVRVIDDVGTDYKWVGTSAGGTGTEWDASWKFKPGIAGGARSATIAFDTDEGHCDPCTLAL